MLPFAKASRRTRWVARRLLPWWNPRNTVMNWLARTPRTNSPEVGLSPRASGNVRRSPGPLVLASTIQRVYASEATTTHIADLTLPKTPFVHVERCRSLFDSRRSLGLGTNPFSDRVWRHKQG